MALVQFLLLSVAGLVVVAWGLGRVSTRVEKTWTRVGIAAFDRFESSTQRRLGRQKALRQAHLPVTYRGYAASTGLKSVAAGLVGGILTIYAVWGVLSVLSIPEAVARTYLPQALSPLTELVGLSYPAGLELLAYQTGGALVGGLGAALGVYYYRWYYPRYLADKRARQIDMTLPMTVSFVYALSRSGMSFLEMMKILADNDGVYGHAAEEVDVAVRNVEVFGVDIVTAVQTMARRSPSANFREFSENLGSVLQTGGSLSEFLHREYQDFRQEAETQQERLLELLETLAEAYVTLGVAGPLFLIVILTVLGISVGNALPAIQLIVYVVLPLGNLAFIIYLSTVVDNLSRRDPTREETEVDLTPAEIRRSGDLAAERGEATDGGTDDAPSGRTNLERLAVYKQWRQVQRRLGSPVRTVVQRPTALLWVTFPLAVFFVGIRLPAQLGDGVVTVREFDDLVIQAILLVFGTFAVAFEVHSRRVEAIESSIPDFLDRLASLNEAGMTVVDSLDQIRSTELGTLDEELDVVWRDVQWGADVETALKRFENRVRTETISRIVTLTTEAMKASGSLGAVLRIAADQAKADRRLKEKRRQEMFTYLVVVYIAFFVFLFIVGVLNNVLIPGIPDAVPAANFSNGADGARQFDASVPPALQNLGGLDEAAYQLTFLHAAVVQGVFSGMIAGQLSTGDLRAGAKHVAILVGVGYLAFLYVL